MVHRKGSQHNNADALSRLPCRQCGRDSHTPENSDATLSEVMGVVTSSPFQTYSTEEMRKLQMEDAIIGPVFAAVKSGRRPLADQVSAWQRESKWLLQQWESLQYLSGVRHVLSVPLGRPQYQKQGQAFRLSERGTPCR